MVVRKAGERARRIARRWSTAFLHAASVALGMLALSGCVIRRDNPLDIAHPFERAIYGYAGNGATVVRRAAEELERLVGSERTIEAFERVLLAQRAVCNRKSILRCVYRKRTRYENWPEPPRAVYYQLEFSVRTIQPQGLSLTVCYGVNDGMGEWDELPEHLAPEEKHCGR